MIWDSDPDPKMDPDIRTNKNLEQGQMYLMCPLVDINHVILLKIQQNLITSRGSGLPLPIPSSLIDIYHLVRELSDK